MANKRQLDKLLKDAGVPRLLEVIRALEKVVRDEIVTVIQTQLTDKKKQQVMARVKDEVIKTDAQVRGWLSEGIPTSYLSGLEDAENQLAALNINTGAGKITLQVLKEIPDLEPHLAATNALMSEAYADFASGMNGMVKGAERVVSDALRRQIRLKIAEGRLTGKGARDVAKEIKDLAEQEGFTVLFDRGGRKWTLERYSEMLSRTHLIKANNEATANRALDFDIDIVEISTHGATDKICAPLEGKLFSISGNSEKYPKLKNQPPFHPSCRHSILLRPDLRDV